MPIALNQPISAFIGMPAGMPAGASAGASAGSPAGLGQWDFIAAVIPQLIAAGGSIASSSIMANAQKSIAAAQVTADALREKILLAQSAGGSMPSAGKTSVMDSNIGGIPVILIVIGAIGLTLYAARK